MLQQQQLLQLQLWPCGDLQRISLAFAVVAAVAVALAVAEAGR